MYLKSQLKISHHAPGHDRSKAKPIRGKDQAKYRQDSYGNEMHYGSFGKDSEKG